MSTWINKAAQFALILCLVACDAIPSGLSGVGQTSRTDVLDGKLTVAAPLGYCVDRQSARQQADGAVVLIGRCSAGSQFSAAVITVTVGAAGTAGVIADGGEALAAYFQTPGGRAALSRRGIADDVQVLQAANTDGAFTLQIAEDGVGRYWRAILGLSGRLVTLSVQGSGEGSLDPAVGRQLLDATIAAMRGSNLPR